MTEGIKYDKNKNRYDLIPFEALDETVAVLTHGAKKYDDDNWKKVRPFWRRYVGAMFRHLVAYCMGEIIDSGTKKHHLASLVCSAWFIIWRDMDCRKKQMIEQGWQGIENNED